ncbi:MAG: DUF4290 domain-containing protein [Bacteroidales bacterium]|nr:DUF4290 domain-containing protein [Bacteroidales bacterium]
MEYNTARNKLIISEYGRNVQKLTKHAIAVEDREERLNFAKMIVRIMGSMNPAVRESGDYKHKLWDHLHIIAGFNLDVDSPYPPPAEKVFSGNPEPISYGSNHIRFRHYGANIVKMIEEAKGYEDGPEKDTLLLTIANHMKKSYIHWNREAVDDDLIKDQITLLSGGILEIDNDVVLSTTNVLMGGNKKKKKKKIITKGHHRNYKPRNNYRG